jgi:hypothetical protein
MNFTSQQPCSHEITKPFWGGGSLVSCIWVPRIGNILANVPLPAPDGGRPIWSGTFAPAARSPAGMDWLGTTYGTWGAVWEGMCSMGRGGTRLAARRGSGRDGVLAFPVRGQRTRANKVRKSTGERQWGDSRTQIGRRCGGRMLSTVRRSSGVSGEGRHGVGTIPAREGRKLNQSRSGS